MKEINIPTSWKGVTLNQWKKLIEIANDELPETETNLEIISVLSGLSVDEVESLPITTVMELMNDIRFLSTPPKIEKRKDKYELNGKSYCVLKDYKGLSTSAYIDFQTLAPEFDKNIVEILSILIIPEGKKYNVDYDIEETREIIGNGLLSPGDALALTSFFGKKFRSLMRSSLRSSKRQMLKTMRHLKKTDKEAYQKLKEATEQSFGSR